MLIHLFTALALASTPNTCDINPDHLAAQYDYVSIEANTEAPHQSLTLWRNDQRVAHQYHENHITEIWHRLPNDQLTLATHFDEYQRSIEYQPSDIKSIQNLQQWQLKRQLATESLMRSLTLVSQNGAGCGVEARYEGSHGNNQFVVVWLTHQQLPKYLEIISPKHTQRWTLQHVMTDRPTVAARFQQWDNDQSTDYADIGDMEYDPLLRKMIHLGFIAQGTSGFYNDQGEDIGRPHHH